MGPLGKTFATRLMATWRCSNLSREPLHFMANVLITWNILPPPSPLQLTHVAFYLKYYIFLFLTSLFFFTWNACFSSQSPFSQRPVKYDKLVILFWLIHFRHIHYITNKINIIWNFVLQNYLGPRHILPSFTAECSIGQI